MIIILGAYEQNHDVLHKFCGHQTLSPRECGISWICLSGPESASVKTWSRGVRSGRILVSSIFMPNCHEGSSHHVKEVV